MYYIIQLIHINIIKEWKSEFQYEILDQSYILNFTNNHSNFVFLFHFFSDKLIHSFYSVYGTLCQTPNHFD